MDIIPSSICSAARSDSAQRPLNDGSYPFEHEVVPRLTDFFLPSEQTDMTIQEVYAALVDDSVRNELILTISSRQAVMAAHRCFLPAELST